MADDGDSASATALRFRVEVPEIVLAGVPVGSVTITAILPDGTVDATFEGRPSIVGIRLSERGTDVPLPPFDNGRLLLKTNLAAGRKVFVTGDAIGVSLAETQSVMPVDRLPGWVGLVPPLAAIVLAICLRNVYVALFAGVYTGALLLTDGPLQALLETLDDYVLGELVQPGEEQKSHMLILLFTMMLGAMVGVMSRSGSTEALVERLSHVTGTRERAQVTTWFLGLVVFFDDYANTLLLGSTMRSVTDRLRISRAKLAFLVDSTAAPVAGLAVISTWVGFEVGQIQEGFGELAAGYADMDLKWDAYSAFLASIPYRFYPLYLIAFVWLIAWTGRDYGSMLAEETRAATSGDTGALRGTESESPHHSAGAIRPKRKLVRNALIPIAALLVLTAAGLWSSGVQEIERKHAAEGAVIEATLAGVLGNADGTRVLFVASFAASLIAVGCVVATRSLTLNESMAAWIEGIQSMLPALVILVLAWGIASVCDPGHLNTAGYLVEATHGRLSVGWMPAVVFVLSAVVSFATGSSFSTMGLLMPLSISIAFHLLLPLNGAGPNHPLMLATIGAVLAGSIFGDHCSPISDTTVLSSAASGCDHLQHVATQLPYAATVGVVSLLFGYVPMGLGLTQPYLLLPVGVLALFLIVRFHGRRA